MREQDWGPNPDHVHSCRGCDDGVGCYEGVCDFDGYCDYCAAQIADADGSVGIGPGRACDVEADE